MIQQTITGDFTKELARRIKYNITKYQVRYDLKHFRAIPESGSWNLLREYQTAVVQKPDIFRG